MSKEYINGDNNCKIIIIIPNLEKKMKPLIYFVEDLIAEISGGRIDDLSADQSVLVNVYWCVHSSICLSLPLPVCLPVHLSVC